MNIAISGADTAWVLMAAAMVMLMTPGLALFYAGMVRTKNVISTLKKNYVALGLGMIIWAVAGYSLAFGKSHWGIIGGLDFIGMSGVGQEANPTYAANIPHLAFMIFQCMFAVIAPALMSGAAAERIRFSAWVAIFALWSLGVYVPVAHWVWGEGGWIRTLGGLDFAGGLVVHMTAGYSALVLAKFLGKRVGISSSMRAHSVPMVLIGTALLWFGWFGFNAGSSLGANGLAAHAFVTTAFGAAAAMMGWMVMETIKKGRASLMGSCIGAVVGLVAVTPAAGFVSLGAALAIGLIAAPVCYLASEWMKEHTHLDDALDVFGCHGLGGTVGAILTAVFASKAVNPAGADGALAGNWKLLGIHLVSSAAVVAYSLIATTAIIWIVNRLVRIRVREDEEIVGLDLTQHGESLDPVAEIPNFQPLRYELPGKRRPLRRKDSA